MTTFTPKVFNDREIEIRRASFYSPPDTLIEVRTVDGDSKTYAYLDDETAHALADWIIANVPKPEPKPLPTKFAAVVKSEDMLWTHAEPNTSRAWIAENGDWSTGEEIRAEGFEVIFAGVEDDTEATADEGVDD